MDKHGECFISNIFNLAVSEYNRMNMETPLAAIHLSGISIILFKGDRKKCEEVKQFIEKIEEKG